MVEYQSISAYFCGVLRPTQCRAARALLGWTQDTLAARSGVNILAIRRFEAGKTDPRASTRDRIEQTLINEGIELTDTGDVIGVSLRLR